MSPASCQPFFLTHASRESVLRNLAFMALAALVFTIPWEDQFVVAGTGTLCRSVGAAGFGLAILSVLSDGQVRVPRPAHLALLLWVLWGGLTILWTVDTDSTISALRTYGQLLLLTWLIFEFAPTRDHQLNLLRAYVLGTCVSAGSTLYAYRSAETTYWERSVAAGFDPNDLCVILALSIPMSFYLMTAETSRVRAWIWRLHPALILSAAVLTSSRGGFLAICAALLIIPLLFGTFSPITKMALGLIVMLALCIIVSLPAARWDRLASIPQELRSGTLGDRRAIWAAGWQLFEESPLFGIGFGAFAVGVNRFLGESIVAHNAYLTVLVETGMIGALLLAAALGLLGSQLMRLETIDRRFWFVIMLTWSLGAMSLSWAHRKPTWLLFALLAAAGQPVFRAIAPWRHSP